MLTSSSGQEVIRESERRKLYGIGAGDSKMIIAAHASHSASTTDYAETWLRVSIQLSVGNAWAIPGHEIASADFRLPHAQTTPVVPPIRKLGNATVETSGHILHVRTPTTLLDFDKTHGEINKWSFMERKVICRGAGPRLTFWRGPTDNDKGGQLGEWKGHRVDSIRSEVRSVRHEMKEESGALEICVTGYYAPPVLAWGFDTKITYTVHDNGKVQIHVKASPRGPAPATLPRVGLEMLLPCDDITRCEWFGLGPGQTYKDMKSAGQLGVWNKDLNSMMYMYDRPQENGNRTETRWVKVTDERGSGIKAILEHHHDHHSHQEERAADDNSDGNPTDRGFDFSLSAYGAHDLERSGHPYQLKSLADDGAVVFRIDDDHHGLGTGACGPDVQDQYQLKMRTFDFTVSLEPITG